MNGIGVAGNDLARARSLTKNVLLAVITGSVLCSLFASSVHAWSRDDTGPTLRDLYSVQVYAVQEVSVGPPLALPAPSETPGASGITPVRAAVPGRFPFGYFLPVASGTGLRSGSGWTRGAPVQPSLQLPSVANSWSLGAKNWRYVGSSGFGVTLGNGLSHAPSWSQPVHLAGIGVYQAPFDDAGRASSWRYAMAIGALDEASDSAAQRGALSYGPAASDASAIYTVAPNLSLASQVQWMPNLLSVGLGGRYSMNDWGSWVLGVSRAQQSMGSGWRYQLGYQVDVATDLQLSWVNEQRGKGYSDLAGYDSDSLAGASVRNQWGVNVPMGRWGELSGTYEQMNMAQGDSRETFGLAQQFWYSPHLRVRFEANRDIATGAYGLGVKLMLPLE